MEDPGKLYAVVAVIAVIFIGIVFYLTMLDRKLSRIERRLKENKNKS